MQEKNEHLTAVIAAMAAEITGAASASASGAEHEP